MIVIVEICLANIEKHRQELELLVTQKRTFEDIEVLMASRNLDLLINQYLRLVQQKEGTV